MQQAHDLLTEQEEAKKREAALKVDEKIQRQLHKDEKRRLVEQRKEQRMQDKVQREREAAAKKVALQEAKEARQARLQLQNELKQARKLKRV